MKRNSQAFRAVELMLVIFLSACEESGPPVPFRLGQTIPLEQWTMTVRQPELISPKLIDGYRGLRFSNEEAKVVAVRLTLEARDSASANDPEALERGFVKLLADCRLKDREGGEYPLGLPLTDFQFRWLKTSDRMSNSEARDFMLSQPDGRLSKDWVLLYDVPKDHSGFTLLIRNRAPLEGQPHIASVDLGR